MILVPTGGLNHKWWLLWGTLVGVWASWVAASTETPGTLFFQISNIFPTRMSDCFMETLVRISAARCLASCARVPTCRLACHKDSDCHLYTTLVSKFWNASASVIPMTEQMDFSCYTSWSYPNDITHHILSSSSFSDIGANYASNVAHDGYFCEKSNIYYYHSESKPSNWYQIDLGKPFKISKIIVKARNIPPHRAAFCSVEVRVGNFSGSGDFSANPQFAFYAGPADAGETVSIESDKSLYGRYVSLKMNVAGYLIIGELNILS